MDAESPKTPSSVEIKKQQWKLFVIAFACLLFVVCILWFLGRESEVPKTSSQVSENAPVYDVTRALEDKSYWVFHSERKLQAQEQTQNKILKDLAELREDLQKNPDHIKRANDAEAKVEALTERLELLESSLKEKSDSLDANPNAKKGSNYLPGANEFSSESGNAPLSFPKALFSETLSLESKPGESGDMHQIENYIPAGTYAKAVLLSGVDVSAGVSSQSSPKPVLLRLINRGSLPNKAAGNMKECRMIAAAFGDISSERAYLRLEKLSCVEQDGNVIETDVDGYISGEDGKNGMRGRVVIRDADVLKRGFMGGLLSGLSKAVNQSLATTSLSPLGATSSISGKDIFKSAGAQGTGDAFELMARYNIQRAEQYQPVIQISAGRVVDVVFHSGSKFGERKVRKPETPSVGPKVGNIFGEQQ